MLEYIINGWWKVLALIGGALIFFFGLLYSFVVFIRKAKDADVDQMEFGPVKVDFDNEEKDKKNKEV